MHIILRLSLIIVIFTIVVHSQGGGGRSSSSRSSRSRSGRIHFYRGGRTCTDGNCRHEYTIMEYVVIGSMLIIFCMALYHMWSNGRPAHSNVAYINLPSSEIKDEDFDEFVSGFWSSRYYQYNAWHGPYQFSLSFDPEMWKVTGNGFDDVGEYTIEGIYSIKNNRMGLAKTYRKGTGNPTQNLGHTVTIQAAWNSSERQFEGKWFVKTSKYSGEDKFELKLEKSYKAIE